MNEPQEDEAISLSEAIDAWAASGGGDEARAEALVELLNYCADAALQVLHDGDREAAEALAELLVPLRHALLRWPYAAELPPFNLFLGCLQALLRGEEGQLARLRAGLDEGLAASLVQIEALAGEASEAGGVVAASEPDAAELAPELVVALESGDADGLERALDELPEHERERTLAALRRRTEARVAQMSPEEQRRLALQLQQEQIARVAADLHELAARTLLEDSPDARRQIAIQMGQVAAHYAAGESPGSPYDQLASFARAVAAILRGTVVPPAPPAYAGRVAELRAIAEREQPE
jgi:hypothetical protein